MLFFFYSVKFIRIGIDSSEKMDNSWICEKNSFDLKSLFPSKVGREASSLGLWNWKVERLIFEFLKGRLLFESLVAWSILLFCLWLIISFRKNFRIKIWKFCLKRNYLFIFSDFLANWIAKENGGFDLWWFDVEEWVSILRKKFSLEKTQILEKANKSNPK